MIASHKFLRQSGITLLEILGALAIGSAMMVGLVAMIDNSLEDMKGQQAASYQAQLATAARNYIAANYAILKGPGAGSAPVGGNPVAVTVATLTGGGFLPQGFKNTNIYLQTGCVLISQPTAGKIDALVITTNGTPIGEKDIRPVAANAGAGSGYISVTTPGIATGASWTLNFTTAPGNKFLNQNCDGGSLKGTAADGGHLVSRVFQSDSAYADYLYRDDVGVPALNTMNTPLRMGAGAKVNEGDTCTLANGSSGIGVNDQGELLRCDQTSSKWTYVTSWKPAVNAVSDLNLVKTKSPGDVRMVMGGAYKAAYIYDGSNWSPLIMDATGKLVANDVVANNVDTDTLAVNGDAAIAGNATVYQNLNANNVVTNNVVTASIKGNGSSGTLAITGDTTITGNATVSQNMTAQQNVVAQDVNARGNVNANGNVAAQQDVTAGAQLHGYYLIVDTSATVESVFFNYSNAYLHVNGGDCVIPNWDRDGNVYYMWPIGSIVAESGPGQYIAGNGKTLYCGADKKWHYVGS